MKLILLGHGTVGDGVDKLILNANTDALKQMEITSILVKERFPGDRDMIILDADEVFAHEHETVCECMGGLEPSHSYAMKALSSGKNYVTSNKAMVATFYEELITTAEKNNVQILFEAAVGGGIPWMINLQQAKQVDALTGFRGIFNGTTNYILDKMTREGTEFDIALKEAQSLGYAERDPSADIDGDDVKYKCCLSANMAFDTSVDLNKITTMGIRYITAKDIDYAKSVGKTIRLIGKGELVDNDLNIYVQPEMIDDHEVLANILLNYNAVILENDSLTNTTLIGQGAGKNPTANAVVSDLVHLQNKERIMPTIKNHFEIKNEVKRSYYVSGNDLSDFKEFIKEQITETSILTEPVSVKWISDIANRKGLFVAGI
ncbi:MAG: homoserine dehydrogenase [Erysipelotrichaceae bacterium]|nr:homoserine dehydrogenase [Erysipelotrichaceae bacterium]